MTHETARDFADRIRRLHFFSYARLPEPLDVSEAATEAERELAALAPDDPRFFLGDDVDLFGRATLDGTIRDLYGALRPLHVVAVGPRRLIELAERLRLSSFALKVASPAWRTEDRADFAAELRREHRRYCGEPVAYLFHAGVAGAAWIASLHGQLRNAFALDLGPALDACLADRVLAGSWGRIHWQAVARHLGLELGSERTSFPSPRDAPLPSPSDAPARIRPEPRRPAVERRRSPATRAEVSERLREGDLERCLWEALERG